MVQLFRHILNFYFLDAVWGTRREKTICLLVMEALVQRIKCPPI